MLIDLAQVLPRPGPLWSDYPQRADDDNAPAWRRPQWRLPAGGALGRARRVARAAAAQVPCVAGLDDAQHAARLHHLRRRLRREGLTEAATAQALAIACATAARTLGLVARETQLLAAAALLDQRMAEMATGEGKTLALALAAAVGALAGMPVHVVTANEYLAARDAERLAPLFSALGLSVAALPRSGGTRGADDDAARRHAYAQDIVYATARELAFDFLRDRLAGAARPRCERAAAALRDPSATAPPLLRGLCMALLDEADSILLDEAEVPLVLSRSAPQAARRAFLYQALTIARHLEQARDFTLLPGQRQALLSSAGEERVAALAAPLGGPWQRPRLRREAVNLALSALHACRRDEHYVLRDGAIELLDEVTGRIATGRVWSRGLHTAVALKEGLVPPAETDTVAQITFQRFFQRYWRLAGLSGTLIEARAELAQVFGAGVVRVPLHQPSRLHLAPPRIFADAPARQAALVERIAQLRGAQRPVLIGTDSVAESQALSQALQAAGIAHRVLNALHDADEAAIVAEAGRAQQVTVATRMAGRGTDIELDAAAHAAGGLHVLSCQANPSRRLDRQLAGRAARHGDNGSAEVWRIDPFCHAGNEGAVATLAAWISNTRNQLSQRREERRRAAWRRELLRQDRHWERRLSFAAPAP